MSIGIDPRKPIELSLPYEYNGEPKPVFKFRRLNGAEYAEVIRLAVEAGTDWQENAYKAFAIGLMDWSNQTDPATGESIGFDLSSIQRVLNPDEALSLIDQRVTYARLNATAKKNSASGAG